MALPQEVSSQEFNQALAEQGMINELNEQEFEEIKAQMPQPPPFPLKILMVALVKDFVDLFSFGFLGILANILAIIILWLWVRKRMSFVKRLIYRRLIFRMILEFIPIINMIPMWTVFVLRGHAKENETINKILEASESLLIHYSRL